MSKSNYFGSKATSGLCQPIIAMMPPHRTYIETHLGGGAIIKKKPPAALNIGIDIDPEAIERFNCYYPVELINDCAHKYLSNFDFNGEELIYCDPPYLKSTRSSKRKYRYDYEDKDHVKLIQLLMKLPCKILLSGYPSALYDELLKSWNVLELQVMNRGGVRTEKLWFNYC